MNCINFLNVFYNSDLSKLFYKKMQKAKSMAQKKQQS